MKKRLLVLCLLLLLALRPACAETAYTALCGGVPVLSLQYDETAFALDTESYLTGTFGAHTWLGMFYNGYCTVELSADWYPDLPAAGDPTALTQYLNALLSDAQGQWLETYTNPQFVSFALYSLNGMYGPSYYAALLSQGYLVHFEIYNLRGGVDITALDTLKGLLDGVGQMLP